MSLPVRADLVGKKPYGAPQLPDVINLNVNENPFPPSASPVADLAAAVTQHDKALVGVNLDGHCDGLHQ